MEGEQGLQPGPAFLGERQVDEGDVATTLAVDIAKLRSAANELMAALITDIAVDRRG